MPPFTRPDANHRQQAGGKQSGDNQPHHQLRGHQRCGLLRVGLKDVDHHVLVNHRPVGKHKPGRRRAAQGQQHQQRFADEGDIQDAEYNHPAAEEHQRHREGEEHVMQPGGGDHLPAAMNKQGV